MEARRSKIKAEMEAKRSKMEARRDKMMARGAGWRPRGHTWRPRGPNIANILVVFFIFCFDKWVRACASEVLD